ncbi:MAG: gluconokinase [Candidatus Latescibacteria bacterium]|nr:gluconokinase [Candidatus Latescibacterota bacterium]
MNAASAEPPFVLALDIGTSSVRTIVFDRLGQPAGAQAQVAYEMRTTPDGGVEIDADHLIGIVGQTLDALYDQAYPSLSHVIGVAVSTFWHNLIGVDADGRAVTPLISWADTRPEAAVPRLRERLDEAATHARTGCVLHASYLPAKLLWLARAHPAAFRQAARWMSIGEYLFQRFFGRSVCSLSMASGTGLFNQHTCTWDRETIQALPIDPDQLSPLTDLQTPVAGLVDEFARRWPALRDVPWWPAVGDGACSNIGSGCVSSDRIALMVGTSGAMRVLWPTETFTIPHGLWCYRADRRRVVMGGALSNGGNVYEWMRDTLRLRSPDEVERDLAAIEPDTHGLTVLPFWAGERSPGWHGSARATLTGLSLHTTPLHILRAGLEATAYCFAFIHRIIQTVRPEARTIIASGGGLLHSPVWMRMMADVLGQPVTASAVPEASSRGAALLALEAAGVLTDLTEAPVPLGMPYAPDPERHERYRAAMERQQRLYDVLIG